MWGMEEARDDSATPTWDELRPYLPSLWGLWSNGIPICPDGGTYSIGRLNEDPRCSIRGPLHALQGSKE